MYSSTGVEPWALAHANHLTTAGESSVTPSPTAPKSVTKFFTIGSAMWNLLADRRIPASRAYTANDLSALCQIFRRPSAAVASSRTTTDTDVMVEVSIVPHGSPGHGPVWKNPDVPRRSKPPPLAMKPEMLRSERSPCQIN